MRLLADYVERFNAAPRSGDWQPMLELLPPEAELLYEQFGR